LDVNVDGTTVETGSADLTSTSSATGLGGVPAGGGGGGGIGRLTGVGVGPGDPDLITVKALKRLHAADRVFVPVGEAGDLGYAERVVLAHLDADRVERLVFALGDDPAARTSAWDAAGATVAGAVRAGGDVAFATIGDPNLYSTFSYLAAAVRRLVPAVEVETVPGITAMQDLAARSGTVLAEGTQSLVLLPFAAGGWPPGGAGGPARGAPSGAEEPGPAPGLEAQTAAVLVDRLRTALDQHDTVVVYKGGRLLPEVRMALRAAGREGGAVFGARLGLDGESVGSLPDGPAPYLSTVLVPPPRGPRGEREGPP
jgi:precorrin-2/cobalt-factor-2 C20-methyltransferase